MYVCVSRRRYDKAESEYIETKTHMHKPRSLSMCVCVCLSLYVSLCLCVSVPLSPSLRLLVDLCVCLCVYVCMYVCVSRRRYDKAEAEYIEAKTHMHKRRDLKDQLTEHLMLVIQQVSIVVVVVVVVVVVGCCHCSCLSRSSAQLPVLSTLLYHQYCH